MRNLLAANFRRLRQDRVFWLTGILVTVLSLVFLFNGVQRYQNSLSAGFPVSVESCFFIQAPIMGLSYALFTGLFLGVEQSDGTLRGKLCVGHGRNETYLAYFITCLMANIFFLVLWFVCCCPMFFLLETPNWNILLPHLAVTVGFTTAMTALFQLPPMLIANRAYSAVSTLGLYASFALIGSALYDRLSEPATKGGFQAFMGQKLVTVPLEENPLYIGGTLREVLQLVLDFLPSGQAVQVYSLEISTPWHSLSLSVLFTYLCLLVGMAAFRRKNIR